MKQSVRMGVGVAAAAVSCLISSVALAGIADSPLPVLLAGKKTIHLYSVPLVVNYGGVATFFACTSTDTATMQVGVEGFPFPGGAPINDATADSLSFAPGATVIFGTSTAAAIPVDSTIGFVSRGSARILSTSKKLVCNVFMADVTNAPPTSMAQLTIIAKVKQKAAN
jgi:hypothetical protein